MIALAATFAVTVSLLAGGLLQPARGAVTADTTVTPPVASTSQLALGVTHTQYSLDAWTDPTARAKGEQVLTSVATYQNQHIMGWGVNNPEPSPGVYDWSRLDERVALMRETGATMVLTLAGAPDWMKGGEPGQTDWSKLDIAPTPAHYQDFAKLAATIAKRYPDVHYFQVWNELKGFWDTAHNRWDYADYTAMYNDVYDALKAVNPAIQVGGPYVVMTSWSSARATSNPSSISGTWGVLDQRSLDVITYWLAHKHGADFLAIDGSSSTRDKGVITAETVQNEYFSAVDSWLKAHTNLPIWWSEFYPGTSSGGSASTTHRAAVTADAVVKLASSGARVALLWQPEAASNFDAAALWTSPVKGGGVALPLASFYAWWKSNVRPGSSISTTTVQGAPNGMELLRVGTEGIYINATPSAATLRTSGQIYAAPAYSLG